MERGGDGKIGAWWETDEMERERREIVRKLGKEDGDDRREDEQEKGEYLVR